VTERYKLMIMNNKMQISAWEGDMVSPEGCEVVFVLELGARMATHKKEFEGE
jgi:hypothetical protein